MNKKVHYNITLSKLNDTEIISLLEWYASPNVLMCNMEYSKDEKIIEVTCYDEISFEKFKDFLKNFKVYSEMVKQENILQKHETLIINPPYCTAKILINENTNKLIEKIYIEHYLTIEESLDVKLKIKDFGNRELFTTPLRTLLIFNNEPIKPIKLLAGGFYTFELIGLPIQNEPLYIHLALLELNEF